MTAAAQPDASTANDRPVDDRSVADLLWTLVCADGTTAHPYVATTLTGQGPVVNRALPELADAMHYLCLLHGRHPGVIDHAAVRIADNAARNWLIQSVEGFAAERAYLTRVTVAVGPLPSTAGQNASETAVVQQRHAMDMLAQSDRRGTAIGAAMALVLDWTAIRKIIDVAALRAGLEPKPSLLPARQDTLNIARAIAGQEAVARALLFGGRQLLGQHNGLWTLLESRAKARTFG